MARALEGIVLSGQIRLEGWDPDGDAYVVFQRPSRWEAEQLASMQARSELVWNTDEQGQVSQRDRTPLAVLESEMVVMCLVECNIPVSPDSDKLVFQSGVTCRAPKKNLGQKQRDGFYRAWYTPGFPDELAEEIVLKLIAWHPPFNWRVREESGEV